MNSATGSKTVSIAPDPAPRRLLPGWSHALDGLLIVLLAAVCFLLGCYEVYDSDVWWHLRGGHWILENGRVPGLDPFSYASQDRVWIDLPWLFQVLLSLVYGGGGMAAVVVLTAAVNTAALLTAVACRRAREPVALAVACWLPAVLLMSWRFVPRPEMFTLLFTALYLLILGQLEHRPRLGWLLPPLQVLWVNVHGLFILGPILVGFYLLGEGVRAVWQWTRGGGAGAPWPRAWWYQAGGVAAAVVLACLVNPYFVAGATFPIELLPKVTDPGNVYKQYITEFMTPREFARYNTVAVAADNWHVRALYFLLLAVPASFWLPAVWRAWAEAGAGRDHAAPARAAAWLTGLAVVTGLLGLSALTLPGGSVAPGFVAVGDVLPLGLLPVALVWAGLLGHRSGAAAGLALAGGVALALGMMWLRDEFFAVGSGASPRDGPGPLLSLLTYASWAAAALLSLCWGGNLFRLLAAGAFAYLSLQALRNTALFGLVGGTVLAWNLGEWAGRLGLPASPGKPEDRGQRTEVRGQKSEDNRSSSVLRPLSSVLFFRRATGWGGRLGLAGLLVGWGVALVTDRFHGWTGGYRHFGFRERPLEFAHEAARFAGQPGLPERALVYDLSQTGVYVFHNAPARKIFLDARLEVPDRQTFETYMTVERWLRERDPRWPQALAGVGSPLVLLNHRQSAVAEAELLVHPEWRCVYYDAVGAVFVPRGAGDGAAAYPTVDFADRHFRHQAPVPPEPGATLQEGQALYNLGAALPRTGDPAWTLRIPLFLAALGRLAAAADEDPARERTWSLLGYSYWGLLPDPAAPAPTPAEPWDSGRGILWAQATYCFRRALELAPADAKARVGLYLAFEARRMTDAQLSVGQGLLEDPQTDEGMKAQVQELRRYLGPPPRSGGRLPDDLEAAVTDLLHSQRPEAAVRLVEEVERARPVAWTWPLAERVGGAYLHLGRPADARRVWQQTAKAPSEALRLCRLAATFWVEREVAAADRLYLQALEADARLAEAWRDLAWLHAQRGQAEAAERACRERLRLPLDDQQRKELLSLRALLRRYTPTVPVE
jgi:tetratricopeptide (TPR) repeat protein